MSKTFHLEQGAKYHAKFDLSWYERAVGDDTIESKLEAAGFTGVTVQGSGEYRYAEGTWSQPDQDVELPDEVTSVDKV